MDSLSNRGNRPAASQVRAAQSESSSQQPQVRVEPERVRRSQPQPRKKWPLVLGGIILLLANAAVAGYMLFGRASTSSAIDSGKYQAVFFTNGQVYFGKLQPLNEDYMRLEKVFYLQTKSASEDSKASPQSASKQDASDVELIKLGNEIHGPQDEMVISRDQILFFENLKDEGTVSKTIKTYLDQNKQ